MTRLITRVELMQRYSNTAFPPVPDIAPTEKFGHPEHSRQYDGPRRMFAIRRRLSPEIIEQLVCDYEAGVETTELTVRYELGKGTVLKLLREHGATMRRQGLSPAEIDEAVQLYADGWSLARIGQRFGRAHTVIRKALLDRGVQLRPRNGWPR